MAAFVSALKSEYGDNVAQMASSRLQGPFTEGKPLTAFMVKQVTAEARTAAAGVFISGEDFNGNKVENSLDAALDACFGRHKINPEAFSPEQKDLREIMKRNIAQDLLSGRCSFNSSQEMFNAVQGEHLGGAMSMFPTLSNGPEDQLSRYPGSLEDKAWLCQLLDPDNTTSQNVSFAAWRLGEMRIEQPAGQLTPAAIWKACFNEAIPQEASAGPGALAKAMGEKVLSMRATYIAGLPALNERQARLTTYQDCLERSMDMLPFAMLEAGRQGSDMEGAIALEGKLFHNPGKAPTSVLFLKLLTENRSVLNSFGGDSSPLEFSFTGKDGANTTLSMTPANMLAGAHTVLEYAIKRDEAATPLTPLEKASKNFTDSFNSALSVFAGEGAEPVPDAQANTLFMAMGQNGNFLLRQLEMAIGVPFDPENTSYAIGLSHGENGDIILRHSISDVAVTPDGERTQTERSHLVMVIHADGTVGDAHVHVGAPRQPA
jgi:hypothetical protein